MGTCILGAKCVDGIALVADRKIVYEDGRIEFKDKLFCDYYPTVVGAAGSEVLYRKYRPEAIKAAQEISGRDVRENISGTVHVYSPSQGDSTVLIPKYLKKLEAIVRGINSEYASRVGESFEVLIAAQTKDAGSRLYYISDKGVQDDVDDYKVIGSAEPYTQPFLRKQLWHEGLTMKDFGEIAFFVITYLDNKGIDPNTGVDFRKPQIWYIPDTGELEGHNDMSLSSLHDKNMDRLAAYDRFMRDLFKK